MRALAHGRGRRRRDSRLRCGNLSRRLEVLPPPGEEALQAVAQLIPLTHVFDAVRIGIEDGTVAWGQLGIAAIGAAVLGCGAMWFVGNQLRRFRRNGWITKFI